MLGASLASVNPSPTLTPKGSPAQINPAPFLHGSSCIWGNKYLPGEEKLRAPLPDGCIP